MVTVLHFTTPPCRDVHRIHVHFAVLRWEAVCVLQQAWTLGASPGHTGTPLCSYVSGHFED